jgi:sulfite reductase (ferredoxin)
VAAADLPALHARLEALGLGTPGASTIRDITSCPGTDTCKLGISSSRGLAAVLEDHLQARDATLDAGVKSLRVKTSGCFNSCGQHHVADVGFLGVSRNVGGRRVPHFQLVLGGKWGENAGAYGLGLGAFPSKNIPAVLDRVTAMWVRDRQPNERFYDFVQRVGKAKIKTELEALAKVPTYDEDKSFYSDWGDPREYTIGDMGTGECAGEVVPLVQFGLAASEREVFEAQLYLERGDARRAAELALQAMLGAAKALVREDYLDVPDAPDVVVEEFRRRLVETKLFHDTYAGDKFSHFLFKQQKQSLDGLSAETAHQRIEEASLFIEAAHACYDKMLAARAVKK